MGGVGAKTPFLNEILDMFYKKSDFCNCWYTVFCIVFCKKESLFFVYVEKS